MSALTVKQLATVCTGNPKPPWHLGGLLTIYKVKSLSVRTLINKIGANKVVFYVQVRDLSVFSGVTTSAELLAAWSLSSPSKATLVQLNEILGSVGASIVYLDRSDWRNSIGISGTFNSLAGLKPLMAQVTSGIAHIGEAGVAAGGVAMGFGAAATGEAAVGGTILVLGGAVVGIAGALIIAGVGVYELVSSIGASSDTISQNPGGMDAGAPSAQYGPPPPGVDPNNPPDTAVDPSLLPALGPVIGPIAPNGQTTCPGAPPVCLGGF